MVRYLLDTNICIYIAKHNPAAVRERFSRHTVDELVMSAVTLGNCALVRKKASGANAHWPSSHNWKQRCKPRH